MRVSVERMPGSTVAVEIFADEDEFGVAVEKAFRKINRDIAIPGFRKGKAPRNIIERMVGREAVLEEAGRDMMDDLFRRAIEQEQLVPVGEPAAEVLQLDPVGFKVTVQVFPEPTLGDYASVRVEPREVDITDDEVQTVLNQLQTTHATWLELDTPRPPQEGEQVTLDINVFEGDAQFQEPATDATFVLGESNLFEAIENALKMMTPGTSAELTLSFDDDDQSAAPELRGKVLRYEFTLKDVKTRQLPALDDELAKLAGDFDSLDALTAQIRKDLLRNKATEARNEASSTIINQMADSAVVEIPSAMVDREIEDQLTQFRSRLASQRLSLEEYMVNTGQTEEELRAEMRPDAERRVRNSVVLQQIAKAENVEVADADIDAEINRLVAPSENPDRLRTLYSSDYFRGLLQSELFDRKLTERLIEIATEGKGAVTGAGAEALRDELTPPARAEADNDSEGTPKPEAEPGQGLRHGDERPDDESDPNVVEFDRADAPEDPAGEIADAAEASRGDGPNADEATANTGQSGDAAREDWSNDDNAVNFGAEYEPESAAEPLETARQASEEKPTTADTNQA